MSMIYCERCNKNVDTDFHLAIIVKGEEICEDCGTDEEVEEYYTEHTKKAVLEYKERVLL